MALRFVGHHSFTPRLVLSRGFLTKPDTTTRPSLQKYPVKKKPSFYVCKRGRKTGIFTSWDECVAQTSGFPGAVFKSFFSRQSAEEWFAQAIPANDTNLPPLPPSTSSRPVVLPGMATQGTSGKPTVNLSRLRLSLEQQTVVDRVVNENSLRQDRSIYFTGAAGTGKATTLQACIRALQKTGRVVAVTAIDRKTAVLKNGITLESWAGIDVLSEPLDVLLETLRLRRRATFRRWTETDVLVVADAHMISSKVFTRLEAVARGLRENDLRFGGIQLVMTGNFNESPDAGGDMAFESECWSACISSSVVLQHYWGTVEPSLRKIMADLRNGELTNSARSILQSMCRRVQYVDRIRPIALLTSTVSAEAINATMLENTNGVMTRFTSSDLAGYDQETHGVIPLQKMRQVLDEFTPAPEVLDLKMYAQVIVTKDIPQLGLKAGNLGKVISFRRPSPEKFLKACPHDPAAVQVKSSDVLAVAQRCEASVCSLEELWVRDDRMFPLVQFTDDKRKLIRPMEFAIRGRNDQEARRVQLPLRLGWASSVDALKGQTVDRCKIDAKNLRGPGQLLAALSRASSMHTLQLTSLEDYKE